MHSSMPYDDLSLSAEQLDTSNQTRALTLWEQNMKKKMI